LSLDLVGPTDKERGVFEAESYTSSACWSTNLFWQRGLEYGEGNLEFALMHESA